MYKSWNQKVRDKTAGYYVCSRKGIAMSHIQKMSDEMLNDYSKIFYLQFKKIMNSLNKGYAEKLLPGLKDKDSFKSDNINHYVTEDIFKFGLSKERNFNFSVYDKFNIYEGLSSLVNHAMSWCELLPKLKNTPFLSGLTPLDWYGDLEFKEYIPPVWRKIFKALEAEFPTHKIEQICFIEKCAKSATLNPSFFRFTENVQQAIYMLEYSGDKNLAIKLAEQLEQDNSNVNKNLFNIEQYMEKFLFNTRPEFRQFFDKFLKKINDLDDEAIFDTEEECFQVALAYAPIQKRFMKMKDNYKKINNPKELVSRLDSYFIKSIEPFHTKLSWLESIKEVSIVNADSFNYAKIVIFCAVDKKLNMLPEDVKDILIEELEHILDVENCFKPDAERIERQTRELILKFDKKTSAIKPVNKTTLVKF